MDFSINKSTGQHNFMVCDIINYVHLPIKFSFLACASHVSKGHISCIIRSSCQSNLSKVVRSVKLAVQVLCSYHVCHTAPQLTECLEQAREGCAFIRIFSKNSFIRELMLGMFNS